MPITLLDNTEETAIGIENTIEGIIVKTESGKDIMLGNIRTNKKFERFLIQQLDETRISK